MDRSERIALAIRRSGKKNGEIAAACGVTPSSVTQWMNGLTKSIKPENLAALAAATGTTMEWIATGNGPMEATGRVTLDSLHPWDDSTPMDPDDVELPLFKEVEIAAGDGTAHQIEINGRKLRFSRATLRAAGVDAANAACATAKGRSMERLILDGATIGIDRGRTEIKDGKIYAIDHQGELRVKYLYRQPGGALRVRSENADEYPDENYGPDWHQQIKVLGWVFWWSRLETW
jgi:phage repressor protein C with HTH and peptisase S24 domain